MFRDINGLTSDQTCFKSEEERYQVQYMLFKASLYNLCKLFHITPKELLARIDKENRETLLEGLLNSKKFKQLPTKPLQACVNQFKKLGASRLKIDHLYYPETFLMLELKLVGATTLLNWRKQFTRCSEK